ncbi:MULTISPECIES: hypothetical protein [Clavibacter]|uniref:Uncharacterized protein n=1 Tax=Clavibacter tessellarius TaxID=31965 RepID=A0A154UXY5_9MICO|nr:hypothetical protein [Clavibacter michiganensis]KZC93992.1 hypothetical protein AWH51_15405 [Clavibacter michiganensis subsp. tessellarius]
MPAWRSPFTQAVLGWTGLILGVVGLLPLAKVVEPVVAMVTDRHGPPVSAPPVGWTFGLLAIVAAIALVTHLFGIARHGTRHPLCFGFALSGSGKRITIERVVPGPCPLCGGRMRYVSRPTGWRETVMSDGRIKKVVTERVPALVCARNSRAHWFEVDPAER